MNATTDATDRPAARWRVVILAATLGILAIGLGFPRLVVGVLVGPQDETLRELAAGKDVPAAILRHTAESREAALRWIQDGAYYSDLAVLRLYGVGATRILSPERRRLVDDGVALQVRALALSPADGYGWTRLLQALALGAAPAAQVEPVLDMAIRRAPAEPSVVMMRLHVAFLYWRGLSAKMRAEVDRQIRLAALWMPTDLARLAKARFRVADVAATLASDPRLAARFAFALTHV